ncbi:hypothetical protein [Flavobacterium sp.]|uniref:hypothetical protein n=1 Tax=Flavobacterium sp. TaxID=239 RepID=UPI0026055B13|nr:hypothetical protein [Flavobacterium sp.]
MKKSTLQTVLLLFSMSFLFNSCELIGGIFKTGMGIGVFLTLVILVIIIFAIRRFGNKKSN